MHLRGKWTFFDRHNSSLLAEGEMPRHLASGPDGRIWVAVNEEVVRVESGITIGYERFRGILVHRQPSWTLIKWGEGELADAQVLVNDIACDPAGNLWLYGSVNSPERLLFFYNSHRTVVFRSGEDGLPTDMGVFAGFAFDEAARPWIGIGAVGVFYLDNGRWSRFESDVLREGPLSEVGLLSKIVTDPSGRLWVALQKEKSTTFLHLENGNFVPYATAPFGYELTWLGALAIDHEQNLWAGWYDLMDVVRMGLWKLPPGGQWQKYSSANSDLPDEQIRAITFDHKGRVWVASMGGVTIFEGSESVCWNAIAPGTVGTPLCTDEEGFIKGTDQKAASSTVYVGLNVTADSYGRIWALGLEGIARFEEAEAEPSSSV